MKIKCLEISFLVRDIVRCDVFHRRLTTPFDQNAFLCSTRNGIHANTISNASFILIKRTFTIERNNAKMLMQYIGGVWYIYIYIYIYIYMYIYIYIYISDYGGMCTWHFKFVEFSKERPISTAVTQHHLKQIYVHIKILLGL